MTCRYPFFAPFTALTKYSALIQRRCTADHKSRLSFDTIKNEVPLTNTLFLVDCDLQEGGESPRSNKGKTFESFHEKTLAKFLVRIYL
jgi:hypothetical protein